MQGWPIATVAFYGPNLSQATKVAVAACHDEALCGSLKLELTRVLGSTGDGGDLGSDRQFQAVIGGEDVQLGAAHAMAITGSRERLLAWL